MSKTNWKDADGTVATVTETPTRGGTLYTVVFTYKVDGHWCGGTIRTYEAYKVGDSIAVRYDPTDPTATISPLLKTAKSGLPSPSSPLSSPVV